MSLIEKLYSFIIFISVIIGICIGQFEIVRGSAEFFIVPLLVIMLYITFLQIPIEDIKISFKNLRFTSSTIIMNFVWTPILHGYWQSCFYQITLHYGSGLLCCWLPHVQNVF